MKPPYRLLLLTFLASFAVISIERSVYFFTTHRMGFSDQANLWLALGFGLTYVAGSLLSHPLARRLGEKRLVAVAFVSQIVLGGLMGLFARPWWYFTAGPLLGFVIGLQWPVIESYVAAGRETRNQQRIIGLFNLAWAGAIPLNLAVTGPLIEWLGAGMFYVPAVLNLVTLVMLRPLPAGPPHIPEDHPHRPSPEERRRLGMLLASHRWLMLGSYAAMFVLAPLLPAVFERLAVGETIAPALSGLLDAIRIAGFAALWLLPGWHGRRWPIVVSLALLPVGFFAALYGTSPADGPSRRGRLRSLDGRHLLRGAVLRDGGQERRRRRRRRPRGPDRLGLCPRARRRPDRPGARARPRRRGVRHDGRHWPAADRHHARRGRPPAARRAVTTRLTCPHAGCPPSRNDPQAAPVLQPGRRSIVPCRKTPSIWYNTWT